MVKGAGWAKLLPARTIHDEAVPAGDTASRRCLGSDCSEAQNAGMDALFRFPTARRRDREVDTWFAQNDALRGLAQPWFERIRACGPDVRELIHDRRPTACAEDVAFAYVDAYGEHANIGFFFGAFLDDSTGLMEGGGKKMRHVKLRVNRMPDEVAFGDLITAAYHDIRRRIDEA
jgi:hypothetical protein